MLIKLYKYVTAKKNLKFYVVRFLRYNYWCNAKEVSKEINQIVAIVRQKSLIKVLDKYCFLLNVLPLIANQVKMLNFAFLRSVVGNTQYTHCCGVTLHLQKVNYIARDSNSGIYLSEICYLCSRQLQMIFIFVEIF